MVSYLRIPIQKEKGFNNIMQLKPSERVIKHIFT